MSVISADNMKKAYVKANESGKSMTLSDLFKKDCKDCIHFNPKRLQDETQHHCLKWLKCTASFGCSCYEPKEQSNRKDVFYKAKTDSPRLAHLENGDRFCTLLSAFDLTTLRAIYNQQFFPLGVEIVKLPTKKWLPFIKKRCVYIEFEFTGDKT